MRVKATDSPLTILDKNVIPWQQMHSISFSMTTQPPHEDQKVCFCYLATFRT